MSMSVSKAFGVKLIRLCAGVGYFCSLMHKWDLPPFSNCECSATEQTAEHISYSLPHIGHPMEYLV